MAEHYKTKCRHCGTIMTQCRCPDPNKTVRYDTCSKCKASGYEDHQGVDKMTLAQFIHALAPFTRWQEMVARYGEKVAGDQLYVVLQDIVRKHSGQQFTPELFAKISADIVSELNVKLAET